MLQRTTRTQLRNGCLWSRAQPRVESAPRPIFTRSNHASRPNSPHVPTPVEKIVCDSIRASGPIPVSTYIQLCLSHPTEGYYMKPRPDDSDVFGVKGDFTTSPEISQVFGELVAIWFLSIWRNSKTSQQPQKIRLVELGPGRGTLMHDILRTLSMWPQSKDAVTGIHLVESSPVMRSRQAQKLAAWCESRNIQLHWWDSVEDIPDASENEFNMVVAHEFFDALPVNILEKTSNGFREVMIDLQSPQVNPSVGSTTSLQPTPILCFVLSQAPTARSDFLSKLSPRFASLPPGSRVEVSSSGWRTARKIGEIVSGHRKQAPGDTTNQTGTKGAALIIDYGDKHIFGSSFRGFRAHRHVDVFEKPGVSDLTTNVDFTLLMEALQGVGTAHGPLDQASFLLQMGLTQRLAGLVSKAQSDERRSEISAAGKRLVDTSGQGMGRVYQVLGITGMAEGQKADVWPFISSLHSLDKIQK